MLYPSYHKPGPAGHIAVSYHGGSCYIDLDPARAGFRAWSSGALHEAMKPHSVLCSIAHAYKNTGLIKKVLLPLSATI